MPTKLRDRVEPQFPQQEDEIEIEVDDDQLESSSWAQGGMKKQKLIEIPNKAREKALQILRRGSQCFDNIRHNFLIKQVSQHEQIPNKIELLIRMLDERIVQAQEFINLEELKSFLFKVKQNELILQLQLGDSLDKIVELVQKL